MRVPHFVSSSPEIGKYDPPSCPLSCHTSASHWNETFQKPHPIFSLCHLFPHSPEEFHRVGVKAGGFGFPAQNGLKVGGFPGDVVSSRIRCCKTRTALTHTCEKHIFVTVEVYGSS